MTRANQKPVSLGTLDSELDDLIEDIMAHPGTALSADASNAVNFARSTHPIAVGKDTTQRAREVIWAVAGHRVHGELRMRLERLYARAVKEEGKV